MNLSQAKAETGLKNVQEVDQVSIIANAFNSPLVHNQPFIVT